MSNLAALARTEGHEVTGSDEKTGGHDAKNVIGADLVVYSSAIKPDNVELVCARKLGLPTLSRAEYLGRISEDYETVFAVCGCHGKTTTTAILYALLSSRRPALNVGGTVKLLAPPEKKILVTEACEYMRNFLYLKPDFNVITNVDFDHPDCYSSLSDVKRAYGDFCAQSKLCFVNADDENSAYLLKRKNVVSYGFNSGEMRAEITAFTPSGYKFAVGYRGVNMGEFSLNLKGRHYLYDALAAVVAALCYGLGAGETAARLASFCGVPRRNEYVGKIGACAFYSDYAHHPKEIESELVLLKSQYESVCVAFQPHTFSRTKSMLGGFVKALSKADLVLLLPTYAARENGADGDELYRALKRKTEVELTALASLNERAKALSVKFGAIAYVGAGNVDGEIRRLFGGEKPVV